MFDYDETMGRGEMMMQLESQVMRRPRWLPPGYYGAHIACMFGVYYYL